MPQYADFGEPKYTREHPGVSRTCATLYKPRGDKKSDRILPPHVEAKSVDELGLRYDPGWTLTVQHGKGFWYTQYTNMRTFINLCEQAIAQKVPYLYHEVIPGKYPQRPKFDLDKEPTKAILEEVQTAIYRTFEEVYNIYDPELVKCSSSGYDTKIQAHKKSWHLIIPNYAFLDHKEAHEFTTVHLHARLSEAARNCLDYGVNSSLQHFRFPGSTKNGRQKRIPTSYTIRDVMVTPEYDPHGRLITRTLPRLKPKSTTNDGKEEHEADNTYANDIPEHVNDILAIPAVAAVAGTWAVRQVTHNMIYFTRQADTRPECEICGTAHDRDNTLMLYYDKHRVVQHCRHNRDKRKRILVRLTADTSANQMVAAEIANPQKDTPTTVDTTDRRQLMANYEAWKARPRATGPATYPAANVVAYESPTMNPFPQAHTLTSGWRTMYVKAGMGMGKSKAMIDCIRGARSCIWVTNRKTVTDDLFTKLRRAGIPVESYMDLQGPILIETHPFVIVQLESLPRVDPGADGAEFAVIDESESVIKQFASGKDINGRVYHAFRGIVARAGHCLAMDADLGQRTTGVIRAVRGSTGELMHINAYCNMRDKRLIFVTPDALVTKALELVAGGKRIVVPTNDKGFADSLAALLREKFPEHGKRIGLYTADTDETVKRAHFRDVSTHWGNLVALIYSPTCQAGVSFESEHYDVLLGYFTDQSTDVEDCRQAMHRVRNIASGEYWVSLKTRVSNGVVFTSPDQVREYYQNLANSMPTAQIDYNTYQLAMVEDGAHLRVADNAYNTIIIHNKYHRNVSRTRFFATFLDQCVATGMRVELGPDLQASGTREAVRAKRTEVRQADRSRLARAANLTDAQADALTSDPRAKSRDDQLALDKYYLAREYEVAPETISETWLETYAKPDVLAKRKRWNDILQCERTQDSLDRIREREQIQALVRRDDIARGDGADSNAAGYIVDYSACEYPRHKWAFRFLEVCGWTGPLDTKPIPVGDIEKRVTEYCVEFRKHQKEIDAVFDKRRPMATYSVKSFVDYMNGVLSVTYGCTISRTTKTNKKLPNYTIRHQLVGRVFNVTRCPLGSDMWAHLDIIPVG